MGKCNLSKDKIKEGIIEAVTSKVTSSNLFKINNDIISPINNITTTEEWTEELFEEVRDSKKYKSEILGAYKESFDSNPLGFLREIAEQVHSSESEASGALSVAGPNLLRLAIKLFPNSSRIVEQKVIDKINEEFKSTVIKKTTPNTWQIAPDNNLILKYLATQEGSGELLLQDMRAHYISQFSSTSPNLLVDDLWKTQPALQDPTTQLLIAFMLKINPNAKISEVEKLDRKAVALIRDYIILVQTGSIIDELPHEVAHFFVELLPDDHPILAEMQKNILDLPIWSRVWGEYKNNVAYQKEGKPNIEKIKKEAIAQQIGEYITAAATGKADEKFKGKRPLWRRLLHNFFKYLRRAFVTNTSDSYTEPLTDLAAPFMKAAQDILKGDISNLNIKKIPTIYDSVFFHATEEHMPEGYEASEISLRLFNVTKTLKGQFYNVFKKYIGNKDLKAIKEILDQGDANSYNRVWNIYLQLSNASDLFNEFDEDNAPLNNLLLSTTRLAEAYKEIEMIPKAIREAMDTMAKGGTEKEIIDNVTELQAYFKFTKTFQSIVTEFESTVGFILDNYENKDEAKEIAEKMLIVMGSAGTQMRMMDAHIMKQLTTHTKQIMEVWMGDYLVEHRTRLETAFGKLTDEQLKNKMLKLIYGDFTHSSQTNRAITGDLPVGAFDTLADGTKIDISKIKDITIADHFIFLSSSPTLMSDPFVSHLMRYYNSKFMEYQTKGALEAKTVADSLSPMIRSLERMGVDHYNIGKSMINIQKTYDPHVDGNFTFKKAYRSATKRLDFFHDKTVAKLAVDEVKKKLANMRTDKVSTKEDIRAQMKILEEAADKYTTWLRKVSNTAYTEEYYKRQALFKPRPEDSETLKDIKDINQRLIILEQQQHMAVAIDNYETEVSVFEDSVYNEITYEMSVLQKDKFNLSKLLPLQEKSTFNLMEELYEIDEVETERLQIRHKTGWVNSVVAGLLNKGTGNNEKILREEISKRYDAMYNIQVPTQAYYDRNAEIWEEINKILEDKIEFTAFTKKLEELKDVETKILKSFKDNRREVNIQSLSIESDVIDAQGRNLTFADVLKDIDNMRDLIQKKIKIFTSRFGNITSPETREKTMAYAEIVVTFTDILTNTSTYTPEKLQEVFAEYFEISASAAQEYLSAVTESLKGDSTNLDNFSYSSFKPKNDTVKQVLDMLPTTTSEFLELEESLMAQVKSSTGSFFSEEQQEALDELFGELREFHTVGITLQYGLAMVPFQGYVREYLQSPLATHELREKFQNLGTFDSIEDVETYLGDELFERVLAFMQSKIGESSQDEGQAISDLINFFQSIHKEKIIRVGKDFIKTWTPIKYARKIKPEEGYYEETAPRYLIKNRVREFTPPTESNPNGVRLRTERINELDPEVIAGRKQATVDINGNFLPLEIKGNEYWDEDYAKLKASTTQEDALKYKLLTTMKLAYLKRQVEGLEEGSRLDLVMPSLAFDSWEMLSTKTNTIVDYIKNFNPFSKKTTSEQEVNVLEDISAITAQNRDIYTGLLLNEEQAKLKSMRRIPIERVTDDSIAALLMFFEDINEFTGKNLAAPLLKTFADVFANAHALAPHSNRVRADVLKKLHDVKVLDEIPKGGLNEPMVAKIASILNKIASNRLLADPIGALVNLTSGELQMLIEVNFGKEAFKRYLASGALAMKWLVQYDKDFYGRSDWGLQTQLITIFNMVPDNLEISKQISLKALYSNIRSKLMSPRSETEKLMAIQTGLMTVMGENIVHKGKKITIEELYELNPETNIIQVKDKYKDLDAEWNPLNGTIVDSLRLKIAQYYTLQQGNYYKQNKAYGSYFSIGQMVLLMKQWLPAGIVRRFQPLTYDPITGEHRMGYHLALLNLMGNFITATVTGNGTKIQEYWDHFANTPAQQMAIRKSLAEIMYLGIFGVLVLLAFGYDDDDEDKNRKVREMAYLKQLALLITLRVQSELGTYIPLPVFGLGYMEMNRALLSPIGLPKLAADNIMNLVKLTVLKGLSIVGVNYDKQLIYQNAKQYGYQAWGLGAIKDKGDSKWFAALLNTIGYTGYTFEPGEYIKTFTQMQNRVK